MGYKRVYHLAGIITSREVLTSRHPVPAFEKWWKQWYLCQEIVGLNKIIHVKCLVLCLPKHSKQSTCKYLMKSSVNIIIVIVKPMVINSWLS